MHLNADYFESILEDLIDENMLACAAVLRILDVRYTDTVPTLAVTTQDRPRLLVNLDFVRTHCQGETGVKTLLLHEFLHVLLNHTMDFKTVTPALNIALDAVINSIIHRLAGVEYSSFFRKYYREASGVLRLLAPPNLSPGYVRPKGRGEARITRILGNLYAGKLVVEDIHDLAQQLSVPAGIEHFLLGNHDDLEKPDKAGEDTTADADAKDAVTVLSEAVDDSLRQMDASGIWREAKLPGMGSALAGTDIFGTSDSLRDWQRDAWRVLGRCLTDDENNRQTTSVDIPVTLPVLTPSDRRAWLRAGWSPILPSALSTTCVPRRETGQTAQVYLDVSGSMTAELTALVGLLWKLRRHVRSPFWSFANTVEPAEIVDGQLKTRGSGGTDLNPVLEHILKTGPQKALIITDGYVGGIDPTLLDQVQSRQQLYGIVSRDGTTGPFLQAGIEYAQLGRFTS